MATQNNPEEASALSNQVVTPVEVLDWLEQDLKRLDSRNWTMETFALQSLAMEGRLNDYQKDQYQAIVEDRRAAHTLYAILNNARRHFGVTTAASPDPEANTKPGKNALES